MTQPLEPMNDQVLAALIRMAIAGDMNAAHAVESEIELRGLTIDYILELAHAILNVPPAEWRSQFDEADLFAIKHATAEQIARAALKALPGISDLF